MVARWLGVLSMGILAAGCAATGETSPQAPVTMLDVAPGWANNSVNTVVFRRNSLVTHGDTQFVAFYDQNAYVVLGKRKLDAAHWDLRTTKLRGNARDAHNSISIMVDGAGYLHLAWDHHNHPLHYARSIAPGSLDMGPSTPMIGTDENSLTYPEFHRLANGDLLFLYRNGASGQGNLVMNRYDTASATWSRVHSNLISGEGQRSAYWQTFVDQLGTVHLSWVWRESPDVASNHDMAYARSRDGGKTWEDADGKPYQLPITAASARYAARIPQNSELINQTSMGADKAGRPYIASYWRAQGSQVPQYHLLYHTGQAWSQLDLNFRSAPFSLSGAGTKAIPIARPQIIVGTGSGQPSAVLVFRDAERGSKVSAAFVDIAKGSWQLADWTAESVGAWEPTYDTELWRRDGKLNLFVQSVQQIDGEGSASVAPSMVRVLQWQPRK